MSNSLGRFFSRRAARNSLFALTCLGVLTALEGLVVLLLYLIQPSAAGLRFFLGYSLGRWGLILFNLALVIAILLFVRAARKNQGRTQKSAKLLDSKRGRYALLFLATILFALSLYSLIGGLPYEGLQVYYARLQPLLVWLALASGQVGITLFVVQRKQIGQALRVYFPLDETEQIFPNARRRSQKLILAGLAAVYLLVQSNSFLAVRQAAIVADSIDYTYPATLDFNDPHLWASAKPWLAAILYKLAGNSPTVIDALQLAISSLAWLYFAWVFIQSIRDERLKVGAFALILALSLTPAVQVWNHVLLSESISISLMVVILALWLRSLQKWRWLYPLGLILLLGLWLNARETNVYLCLLITIEIFIVGLLRRNQRYYWLVAAILGVLLAVHSWMAEMPTLPRWVYPLGNIILQRILPNPQYVEYFADNGMPVTPELLSLSGGWAFSQDFAIFNSNSLREFERWLFTYGKAAYIQFLVAHPGYTWLSPLQNLDVMFASDVTPYGPGSYVPAFPRLIVELLYPMQWFWVYLWLSLFAVGFALTAKLWKEARVFWAVVSFFLLTIPHIYLVWHGDAAEVDRHAAQLSIQFHLAVWLLLLLYFDKLLYSRSSRRA